MNDTTVRLQQQKRLTEKEPNMLCALLVLGLCERHRRSGNERLSQDEARRHWLSEEHFVLARLAGRKDLKEVEDAEPNKGTCWFHVTSHCCSVDENAVPESQARLLTPT